MDLSFSAFVKWGLDPAWFGYENLSKREMSDFLYIWSGLGNITICSIWFFIAIWIANRIHYKISPATEDLFRRLNTPVDYSGEGGEESDSMQARVLGMLWFIYGGFISILGLIIPNPLGGRVAFAFCGLFIIAHRWPALPGLQGPQETPGLASSLRRRLSAAPESVSFLLTIRPAPSGRMRSGARRVFNRLPAEPPGSPAQVKWHKKDRKSRWTSGLFEMERVDRFELTTITLAT